MTSFKPIYPSHAIERSAVSLTFSPELPPKVFTKLIAQVKLHLEKHKYSSDGLTLSFRVEDGNMVQLNDESDFRPHTFTRQSPQASLDITPNSIRWTSYYYVNWTSFLREFKEYISTTVDEFEEVTSLKSVKLEYWDRFIWGGNWDDFDIDKLFTDDCKFINEGVKSAKREFHCHSGWFERVEDNYRLLKQVNIDVAGISSPVPNTLPIQIVPSVGIYTGIDKHAPDSTQVLAGLHYNNILEELHQGLISTLGSIISKDMQNQIGMSE